VLLQALLALQSCWLHVVACAPNSLVAPAFLVVLLLLQSTLALLHKALRFSFVNFNNVSFSLLSPGT
jgi:hypothetical protein